MISRQYYVLNLLVFGKKPICYSIYLVYQYLMRKTRLLNQLAPYISREEIILWTRRSFEMITLISRKTQQSFNNTFI